MRKALLGAAIVLFAWGAAVTLTGGIDARIWGVAFRSRDPFRAFAASLFLFLIVAVTFRRELTRDLERATALVRARAGPLAAAIAVAVAAHALAFGTFSVGGSDAYGYVNQAYDWRDGVLPAPIPLTIRLPFAGSDRMQAPLGYRAGTAPQTIVPTYAPGLPLIMAASLVFGACGPFLVVPAFAALFVWLTFRLGTRTAGPLAGLIAAGILAASPALLYQAVWPMSDVPAGALWTGAALFSLGERRRDALAAGLLTAAGLLMRPNLLPVVLVPILYVSLRGGARVRLARLAAFGAPVLTVIAFVAWLNSLWFGSALNSGYGAASELYLWSNVGPNLKLYGRWLWQSQTPIILLALVPLVAWTTRRQMNRRALGLCALMCVATSACYLGYAQFEIWWYLRFLLPAFGALSVLIAAGLLGAARAIPPPYGHLAGAIALWLFVAAALPFAAAEGVFGRVSASERRYMAFGELAAKDLPGNAALVAVQHSGSLRFHTGLLTVRFDTLEPPESADLASALERAAYHPFLVIDDAEAASVRAHFGLPAGAPLPWPIRARMRELGGTTVYDMGSRPIAGSVIALEPTGAAWCDVRHRAPPRP